MNSIAAFRHPQPFMSAGANRPIEASAAGKDARSMELAVEAAVAPAKTSEQPHRSSTDSTASAARQVTESAPAKFDAAEPAPSRTIANVEIDPVTRDVIFQSVSRETGEVVAQFPTEQQMKIRYYTRAENGTSTLPKRSV